MGDIKISKELFDALVRCHVTSTATAEDLVYIAHELAEKQRKIEARHWYGIMQDRTKSADVREHARQMYAELQKVHPDFQYPLGALDPSDDQKK